MSDDLGVDLEEVYNVIATADVMVVRFQLFQRRLLVDFRTSGSEGALIKPVDRATSVEDRFRSIKALRPSFPLPERIMSFSWPRSVDTMVSTGVWQRIFDRVASLGPVGIDKDCEAALAELRREERGEVLRAISGGKEYQTLWQAKTP